MLARFRYSILATPGLEDRMQFTVDHIGRIRHASIKLDGLTVIAGRNNKGKSTIGESLFALVNSQHNFHSKVMSRNRQGIMQAAEECMFTSGSSVNGARTRVRMNYEDLDIIAKKLSEHFFSVEEEDKVQSSDIKEWLQSEVMTDHSPQPSQAEEDMDPDREVYTSSSFRRALSILASDIEPAIEFRETSADLLNDSEESLRATFTLRSFNQLFGNQYISYLDNKNNSASVSLLDTDSSEQKKPLIAANFKKNECSTEVGSSVQPVVLFIDDPDLLHMISMSPRRLPPRFFNSRNKATNFAAALHEQMNAKPKVRSAAQEKEYNKKCQIIIDSLEKAHGSEIKTDRFGRQTLQEAWMPQKISLSNVSVGVQAIELLKEIVRSGSLDDNTFLVLDEPEIHLHPEWQLIYAWALSEIAHSLHTKVLVTTHSPYFIQALQVYSRQAQIQEQFHTYMPLEVEGHAVDFIEADDEIMDTLLDDMAKPFDELEILDAKMNEAK